MMSARIGDWGVESMRTIIRIVIAAALLIGVIGAAEKKVKMIDLPAAVRQAVQEHSKGGTIKGLAMEDADGAVVYEAELVVNGKTRDISFDKEGKVVSVEEETTLEQVPAAARDAIRKKAGSSKITLVEVVTEKGTTSYEAHFKGARGQAGEVKVNAAGESVK